MATTPLPQSVRNAWINRLRDEALRMRRVEVSKCVHVGILIGTYADADGTNAFPSNRTLAQIAGCTEETVTRCVKVLTAVGLLQRKRRPNKSSVYLLIVPLGKPVPWEEHLHLYTDTRQARRKKALKEAAIAEGLADNTQDAEESGNPVQNGVRKPFQDGVPDTVPAGGSEEFGNRSGTGGKTVLERVPDTVPAGAYQYLYPDPDHTLVADSPQPQVGACAGAEEFDQSPVEEGEQPFGRCEECGQQLVRPGAKRCSVHREGPRTRGRGREGRSRAIQAPLMMSVPDDIPDAGQSGTAESAPFQWPKPDPLAPERLCGCGRTYRDRKPGGRCPDCLYAEHTAARSHRGVSIA
ncbi:helix-turn-helix domain-containing protein [Streptomyces sp. TRM68367]|uniref:helix-turn-helix domain-containing protein n=1 Tax=Streptomyces sp. TRM68367 TaxID=2758415 RepID=UPI00165A7D2E|nr:helix-turn-helix domain-containing protein [Streptomyces sp. TRM68367]MBC9729907.1 hypothetical protein [Streptomyces sp. TRM68367]